MLSEQNTISTILRSTINELEIIKLRSLYMMKDHIICQSGSLEMGKKHTFEKGLMFKIYKELNKTLLSDQATSKPTNKQKCKPKNLGLKKHTRWF